MQHTPYLKEHKNSDTIVIFTHGYFGSPNQFDFLTDTLYKASISVAALLLPGHGNDNFRKNRLKNWEAYVQSEIDKHSNKYKNIILVGHSIGGLLSLNASLKKENNVKGVVLLATPMCVRFPLKGLINSVKILLLPSKYDNEIRKRYRNGNSITFVSIFHYPHVLLQLFEINKLMTKTKSLLPSIAIPVLIVHSEKDETVSKKSGIRFFDGLINSDRKLINLKDSVHAFYELTEQEIIKKELINFINKIN